MSLKGDSAAEYLESIRRHDYISELTHYYCLHLLADFSWIIGWAVNWVNYVLKDHCK